jgi:hypothetical protein
MAAESIKTVLLCTVFIKILRLAQDDTLFK